MIIEGGFRLFKTFLSIEKLNGSTLDAMGATQKCQININSHQVISHFTM